MTVSALIKVMNSNIKLEFIDRDTKEVIERGKLSRRDTLKCLYERKVYMVFPTEEKDVLNVLLY